MEGKVGLIPASQFRCPLPDTNPNIKKDNAMEKRKRAVPNRFRPSTAPKPTTMQPPTTVSQAPASPKTDVPENRPQPLENAAVCKSIPWPRAGKTSGNLFEDGNWLLPPNYLDNENKNEHKNTTGITSSRPPMKEEEPKVNEQSAEKCGWGPDCPSVRTKRRRRKRTKSSNRRCHSSQKCKSPKQEDLKL